MAVPRNKRDISDAEYYHNGLQLRNIVFRLMILDFGLDIRKWCKKILKQEFVMEPEDKEHFVYIIKKYGMGDGPYPEYPSWVVKQMRTEVLGDLKLFMDCIRLLDCTPLTSEWAFEQRRYCSMRAKSCCWAIADNLDMMNATFLVNVNLYLPVVDILAFEVKLLDSLMKRDTDKFRKLRKKWDNEFIDKLKEEFKTDDEKFLEQQKRLRNAIRKGERKHQQRGYGNSVDAANEINKVYNRIAADGAAQIVRGELEKLDAREYGPVKENIKIPSPPGFETFKVDYSDPETPFDAVSFVAEEVPKENEIDKTKEENTNAT